MKCLLFTILAILLSACVKTDRPLVVATNEWLGYEPIYYGRELGYFSKKKFHLVEMSNATDVIKAFRNKVVDIAAVTLDEFLLLRESNIDAVIFLVMDISNGADAVVAKKGIRDLSQLKGATIAMENSALGSFMLSRALDFGNLSAKDVTIYPSSSDSHLEDFKKPNVDAVVTFGQAKVEGVKLGGRIIFDSSKIPGEIMDVLIVRREVLTKNKPRIKELAKYWFKSVNTLKEKPHESYSFIAKRLGLSIDELKSELKVVDFPSKEENKVFIKSILPSSIKKMADVMYQKKLLLKKLEYKNLAVLDALE